MYIANGVLGDRVDSAEHAVRVDACLVAQASLLHRGVVHPNIPLWSNRISLSMVVLFGG